MTVATNDEAHRFCRVRTMTEALAEPLSAEDQTVQSMPDTSPTKWHRAHTTWFFETFVLADGRADHEPFDPDFCYLFNSYYEQVGDRHPRAARGMVTRPGIERIAEYRRHVDERVLAELAGNPEPELLARVELGRHHEQQHQELLLMDAKHVLAANQNDPAYLAHPAAEVSEPGDASPLGWVGIDGGVVPIGVDHRSEGFSFDNEGPRHDALVPSFEMADRLVTSGEWLEFMADGGYERPELWLSDGWHRRTAEGWTAPLYWSSDRSAPAADEWRLHTLHGVRPVDPAEPVCHVSFYEADAFATWADARLPTEFEWELAVRSVDRDTTGAHLLDESSLTERRLHPEPAGGATGTLRQMLGTCWEWTASAYRPYPGFVAPPGAIGEYNGKFMINTMVLRGGCAFTPADHVRPTYRNFFHPHTRWHLSGVRLARSA